MATALDRSAVAAVARAASPGGSRLLVIDRRPLMRDCLAAALRDAVSITSVSAFASVEDAAAQGEDGTGTDVTLVNIGGEGLSELALAGLMSSLRAAGMAEAVLLLASTDQLNIAMAIRHGIRGVLCSQTPFDLTVEAIRFVRLGLAVYPAVHLTLPLIEPADARPAIDEQDRDFTPRQRQVLRGLERGMTNKGIANALSVSERTVKAHVKELMRRLGANNRTQVVAIMSHGQGGDGSAL